MRRILVIVIVIAGLAALLTAGFITARYVMHQRVEDLLSAYGFKSVEIGDLTYRDNYLVYRDIQLDHDGFSQVSDIQIPAGYTDLLLQKKPEKIEINALKLSGEYSREAGLDIAGWSQKFLPLPEADKLTLNNGQLDLLTSEGALRFEAKGEIARQPDGIRKVQGAIWAAQNQLTANSLWTGEISPDGRWVYDIEIQNANINFKRLQGSRTSGWLVLDNSKGLIPFISGQIEAGKLTVGRINLMSSHLTLSGPINLPKLIANGKIGGFEGMIFNLELQNRLEGPHANASVETPNLEDMITFLGDLQESDAMSGALTSLLLTPGNLERLRSDIKDLRYDLLELQIYGTVYDLTGKVTAKRYKDGVSQNHVISLDPGEL